MDRRLDVRVKGLGPGSYCRQIGGDERNFCNIAGQPPEYSEGETQNIQVEFPRNLVSFGTFYSCGGRNEGGNIERNVKGAGKGNLTMPKSMWKGLDRISGGRLKDKPEKKQRGS